ncbi:twin-arginine translocase subunit TatB [bacterium]|nr:twin-arginine translocase subunit TatB [bacterium]
MLPGVDFTEMLLLVIIALVFLGPRDLPLMMRKVGRFTGKMRAMAFEFRQSFDELGRQAELEELRKEVADLKKQTGLDELGRDLEQSKRDMERDLNSSLTIHDPAKAKEAGALAGAAETAGVAPASSDNPAGPETASNAAPESSPPVEAEPADAAPAASDHATSEPARRSAGA